MASSPPHVVESAVMQGSSLDDGMLRNLTDEQLFQMANDLLSAEAVLREFEADWYDSQETAPLAARQ